MKHYNIPIFISHFGCPSGTGKNKKSAEQSAAKELCKKLGVKIHETL